MASINSLLGYLDERAIARNVAIPHDEARMQYHLSSNTVTDWNRFKDIITDYYNYHHTRCVSRGGRLSSGEAYGRATELLEKEYRKKGGGDIVSAFNDANAGTNGGLRSVLDIICEAIKAESVERYVRNIFDHHVAPNSWDQKVDMIRQFIACAGPYLSSSIVASQPERYAQNYSELVRSYTEGLRQTSSMFRRL
jgi:hypothetical protein